MNPTKQEELRIIKSKELKRELEIEEAVCEWCGDIYTDTTIEVKESGEFMCADCWNKEE